MDIDWNHSTDPIKVVGRTPDGGFLVHVSLHPLDLPEALKRAERAAINVYDHDGEIYIPMPWLRSELAAMLKQGADSVPWPQSDSIAKMLNETLPHLLEQAEEQRSGR